MAKRSNHYDAAFETYLIATGRPYVAIDESRRALLDSVSLKSMDFIVDGGEQRLLLDVKGRRFSPETSRGNRWEAWTDTDDVSSLLRWEDVLGSPFRAAFVFAYWLAGPEQTSIHPETFEHQGRVYAFYAVWVRDYARKMRQRSPRWGTVTIPSADYRQLRCPWDEFLPV